MSREIEILDAIQRRWKSPSMDKAMKAVSAINNYGIFWIGTSLAATAFARTRRYGMGMCASLGIEYLLCNRLMKPIGARVRPYLKNPEVNLLVSEPWGESFPSGHTGACFAEASSLVFNHSWAAVPSTALSVVTGFSRMYLYVHYLSDVLGGAGVGIISGYLGTRLANHFYDKRHPDSGQE